MIKKNLMLTEQENVDEQKISGVRIFDSYIFNKINEDILGWYIKRVYEPIKHNTLKH